MKALLYLPVIFILIWSSLATASEVIVAKEIENCFYANGKMKCTEGEFKITYYRDGDKIVRTNVFNFKKMESLSDDTAYKVISELSSDPKNNSGALFPQVTRAIGFPGADAVEVLTIDREHIQTVKSTSNYFVISRFKIVKE